jgi:hypothetical protein
MALAIDELTRLGSVLGDVTVVPTGPEHVRFHFADGTGWPARVYAYDAVGEAQARQLVETGPRGRKVVVASRIAGPARQYLASHRWAWLDRRIGAHIPARGRDIELRYTEHAQPNGADTRAAAAVPRLAGDGPIRGRAGIAFAAALLCSPNRPPSFRSIASAVGMSTTAISNAVGHLVAAGLVDHENKPTLPELFWALAEVWQPDAICAVASLPEPDVREFATNVSRLDEPGWALGGDLAATEQRAPLFNMDHRPWLWVPTQVELRRAQRFFGDAPWENRAAIIAVPPTPLVCLWRRASTARGSWPLAHPTFTALDLARDPARGRAILAQWAPEGVDAVWR